jgi:lipopolysaccharide export LptBFGC system permease protein LptF
VDPPSDLARLDADIAALAGLRGAEETSTTGLVSTARLEERLGHDSRGERVELWTRILLPCALVLLFAGCASSVRRGRPAWRSALRIVLSFATAWMCLAIATQAFLSGLAPAWLILALPAGALALGALVRAPARGAAPRPA